MPTPRASPEFVAGLKLVAGLAGATLAATLAGLALGLPTPSLDRSGDSGVQSAGLSANLLGLGSGTNPSLTQGPYQPIVGRFEYGTGDGLFGAQRGGRRHEGLDMFAKKGTLLVSIRDGIVVDRGKESGAYSGGRGNYIAIYSSRDRRSYIYFHLLKPSPLTKGDRVAAGRRIGELGCTGSCDGAHLHFEIRRGRASFAAETKPINPLRLVRSWPQAPR